MITLTELYNSDVKNKKIIYDEKQSEVITELSSLTQIILKKDLRKENLIFTDIFKFFKKEDFLGIYIWGDVGRGKTYIVDLFFSSLNIKRKLRLHYHHFMKMIHMKLNENLGNPNPLKLIAEWIKKNYTIICLDEFFVKDIADAMQLSTLFYYLFEMEIYLVITSNVIPNKLYESGLQRQKFLPAIELLKKYLKIINIDGTMDYRYRNYDKQDVFISPLSLKTFKSIKTLFIKLSFKNYKRKETLEILNRKINTLYTSSNIAWFDFKIICGSNRSQLDYIELATLFDTIFVTGIKIMSNEDVARRFIAFTDEMYDRKINIVISSESPIDQLYNGNILKFDFKRTISRLNEMSTKAYLKDFDKHVF